MSGASFDYLILGGGPAGCAAAARLALARPGASVALVEAGPAEAGGFSDVPLGLAKLVPKPNDRNYGFETVPQPGLGGRRGYQPRGRGLGGSSLINAMVCIRGQAADYDEWALPGWGWADVLPLFRRSENNERGVDDFHGQGGPLNVADPRSPSLASRAFLDAARQCQHRLNPDFNGPSQEGVGLFQLFQKDGQRWNAARAYLDGLKPANLAVLSGRRVDRLLFDGRRCAGALLADGARLEAHAEVVVSAGAFGTPQLLMLSGVGPGEHLRSMGIPVVQDSPGIGENLQDHLDFTMCQLSDHRDLFGIVPSALPQLWRGWQEYKRHRTGLFTSNVAEAGGFLRSAPDVARPDVQLNFCISVVDDHGRKRHLSRGMSLHVCALRPESRGTVRLASPRPGDAPMIDPRFLSDERDLRVMLGGVRIAQAIMAAPAMARYAARTLYQADSTDEAILRQVIRDRADSIYHPVGTCRMGLDDVAPLDPELRVRGIAGLRVADASVMPRLVSGNTQAPSAMIGEKAADLLSRA